jgi:hypothetical protein
VLVRSKIAQKSLRAFDRRPDLARYLRQNTLILTSYEFLLSLKPVGLWRSVRPSAFLPSVIGAQFDFFVRRSHALIVGYLYRAFVSNLASCGADHPSVAQREEIGASAPPTLLKSAGRDPAARAGISRRSVPREGSPRTGHSEEEVSYLTDAGASALLISWIAFQDPSPCLGKITRNRPFSVAVFRLAESVAVST